MQTYKTNRRFVTLDQAYMGPDGVQFAGWAVQVLDREGPNEAFVTILTAWLSGTAHLVGGDNELRRLVIDYRDWIAADEQLTPGMVQAFIAGLLLGGRGAKLGIAMAILSGNVPYMVRDINHGNGRLPVPPREISVAYADGAGTELSQQVRITDGYAPPSGSEIASLLANLFGSAARGRRQERRNGQNAHGRDSVPTAYDGDGRPMFEAGEVKIKDAAPGSVESALIAGGFTKDTDGYWNPPGRDQGSNKADDGKSKPSPDAEWVERPGGGPSPSDTTDAGGKSFTTEPAKAG